MISLGMQANTPLMSTSRMAHRAASHHAEEGVAERVRPVPSCQHGAESGASGGADVVGEEEQHLHPIRFVLLSCQSAFWISPTRVSFLPPPTPILAYLRFRGKDQPFKDQLVN